MRRILQRVRNMVSAPVHSLMAARSVATPGTAELSPLLRTRNTLRHYLFGSGIEIGALHAPLDLTGLPVTEIRYVDYLPQDELRRRFPELGDVNFTRVDILDDGEVLSKIEDRSLDFIIANHFIEHARNPIATIQRWAMKLRPAGRIYMAVPDYRYTFDAERPLTPLQHLIDDYRATEEELLVRDDAHLIEWATWIDKLPAAEIEPRVRFLKEINYSIHFHTFTLQRFLALIRYMCDDLGVPLTLTACADVVPGSNEFIVVLTRISDSDNQSDDQANSTESNL